MTQIGLNKDRLRVTGIGLVFIVIASIEPMIYYINGAPEALRTENLNYHIVSPLKTDISLRNVYVTD